MRSSSCVGLRHLLFQLGNGLRRAHAGDDVLALGVDQELAVEFIRAVRRVARERHARSGLVAGIAVDHRLHVDRRPPLRRDVVLAAVDHGAIVHPGSEHRADGAQQLIPRRTRELPAGALLDERLEPRDQFLEIVDRQRRVFDLAVMAFVLERVNHSLERIVILVGALLHAEHDVAVHLHEAPIAVPREARVVRLLRQGLDGLIVEAEIEDRVHHARHRVAGARAHRNEQRVRQIAEPLPGLLFDRRDARLHLAAQCGWIRALVRVVIRADLGCDGEPGRHRQADAAHLGEVRPLAAEQRFHRAVAVGLPAEQIHVLLPGCR